MNTGHQKIRRKKICLSIKLLRIYWVPRETNYSISDEEIPNTPNSRSNTPRNTNNLDIK